MTKKEKIFEHLLKVSILIGSRAWGGFKDTSDWDIVISVPRYLTMLEYFKSENIHFEHFFGGNYAEVGHTMFNKTNDKLTFDDGKVLNILTYEEDELQNILELNRIIEFLNTGIVGQRMQENKQYRIEIVESILGVLFDKHKHIPVTTAIFHPF